MVRRSREQLRETFEAAKRLYIPLGFHPSGHIITSPQGARLRFAYLENDADAENYQGDNNTRVYVEELGNFPNPAPIFKLMATLRSTKGVPVGFRGTGNPGGPGHGWVKKRYISPAPQGWQTIEEPFTNPWTGEVVMKQRIFIPGRITDHDLLGPEYIANLQMSGSPELVRAWLEGDWDVVAGAYFPEFSRGRHVLEPIDFPKDWRRFTATDWGSARPFWTGWFVIMQREMQARTVDRPPGHAPARRDRVLPRVVRRGREAPRPEPRPEAADRGVGGAACSSARPRGDRVRRDRHAGVRRGRRAVAGRAREQGAPRRGQAAAAAQGGQAAPAGLEPGARAAARRPARREAAPPMLFFLMHCETPSARSQRSSTTTWNRSSKMPRPRARITRRTAFATAACRGRASSPIPRTASSTNQKKEHGMADDRGLEGPEDARLVEAPSWADAARAAGGRRGAALRSSSTWGRTRCCAWTSSSR
jgi:hypothetical protein